MKRSIKKLELKKETVRDLTSAELSQIAAGMRALTYNVLCPPSGATWFAPCESYNAPCYPEE